MKTLALEVFSREGAGKGVARKLRRAGMVPAVIYGPGGTAQLAVRLRDLQNILKASGGANAILEVDVNNTKRTVLLKDVQYDPIRQEAIHADLFEISMDQTIRVMVEVRHTDAEPVGFKTDGILTHGLTEIEVECLPSDIPEFFEADLSALDVGDAYHVSDLPATGVKILTPEDQLLFALVAPTVEAEPEVEEEEVAEGEEVSAEEAEEKSSESDEKSEAG